MVNLRGNSRAIRTAIPHQNCISFMGRRRYGFPTIHSRGRYCFPTSHSRGRYCFPTSHSRGRGRPRPRSVWHKPYDYAMYGDDASRVVIGFAELSIRFIMSS